MTANDYAKIKEVLIGINNPKSWMFIILSMLIGACAHFVRALRNIEMIEPLGYKVRKSMGFFSVMVCYLANYVFPRLGEVLRCSFLQRYEKVPFEKSLGTVVTERAVDLICMIMVFVIAFLLNTGLLDTLQIGGVTLREGIHAKIANAAHNYTLFIILGAVVLFVVLVVLTRKWWSKVKLFVKIKDYI